MPKPKPKLKKSSHSPDSVEATIALRLNSEGALVSYECGNPDCQEQLQKDEEMDFKDGVLTIDQSSEEVECGACQTKNYNEGFTVSKL
jgi:hypothetical protein